MIRRAVVLVACGLSWAVNAGADVPDPSASSVDPCLVLCPAGDIALHVQVKKLSQQPVPGARVDLEYTDCPGFRLCAPTGNEPYTTLSGPGYEAVYVFADGQGRAALPVRASGGCPTGSIRIRADGIVLALRALASPDQNGDGVVSSLDAALLQSKVGTQDPTGDLDCDGSVTSADLALLQAHSGHACAQPTLARPDTWGRIKALYR